MNFSLHCHSENKSRPSYSRAIRTHVGGRNAWDQLAMELVPGSGLFQLVTSGLVGESWFDRHGGDGRCGSAVRMACTRQRPRAQRSATQAAPSAEFEAVRAAMVTGAGGGQPLRPGVIGVLKLFGQNAPRSAIESMHTNRCGPSGMSVMSAYHASIGGGVGPDAVHCAAAESDRPARPVGGRSGAVVTAAIIAQFRGVCWQILA